jgi:hypothetical protein
MGVRYCSLMDSDVDVALVLFWVGQLYLTAPPNGYGDPLWKIATLRIN